MITVMRTSLGVLLGLVVLSSSDLAAGAEVEAKKDGVEVFADATNKSDVLDKLKSGQSLESLERKGMFWQVKLKDGRTGFVSVLSVKHKVEANSSLVKAIKGVVKDGRGTDDATESRARSAVMGVRGLREDDSAGNASNVRPNLRAVYEMEDVAVSDKKVKDLGERVFAEIEKKAN